MGVNDFPRTHAIEYDLKKRKIYAKMSNIEQHSQSNVHNERQY